MDAAGGLPVWLCSVSFRDERGKVVPTAKWRPAARRFAEQLTDRVLGDCGDDQIQRQFRMCTTFCRHRATSKAERALLPEWFRRFVPRDVAGSPVAVLWTKGVPGEVDATRPCLSPGKEHFGDGFYLPKPCERCANCLENERVRRIIIAQRRADPDRYLLETR